MTRWTLPSTLLPTTVWSTPVWLTPSTWFWALFRQPVSTVARATILSCFRAWPMEVTTSTTQDLELTLSSSNLLVSTLCLALPFWVLLVTTAFLFNPCQLARSSPASLLVELVTTASLSCCRCCRFCRYCCNHYQRWWWSWLDHRWCNRRYHWTATFQFYLKQSTLGMDTLTFNTATVSADAPDANLTFGSSQVLVNVTMGLNTGVSGPVLLVGFSFWWFVVFGGYNDNSLTARVSAVNAGYTTTGDYAVFTADNTTRYLFVQVAPTTSLLASLTMISSLLVLAALPSQVTPSDSAADPLTGLIPSFYVRLFLPLTPPLRGGFFMVISLTYPLLDCFCGFSSIYLDTDWMRPKCSFKYRLSNWSVFESNTWLL